MSKKYIYDPESVSYIEVNQTLTSKLKKVSVFLGVSLLVGVSGYSVTAAFYQTPKEKIQAQKLDEMKMNQSILESKIVKAQERLHTLVSYDDSLYRTMLGEESLAPSIRNAGTGGVDKYEELAKKDNLEAIAKAYEELDDLVAQMSVQEKSYHFLFKKASENADKMKRVPAIIPVANWDLKRIGSGFSPRRFHPILKCWREHKGIDFVASTGTEIYSSGDGVVKTVRLSSSFGKVVVIDHGYGIESLYAHMDGFKCKRGEKVTRGQLIGYVGNTGLSSGPHLHYEIHMNGKAIDPVNYFFNDLTPDEYRDVVEHSSNIVACME